MTARIQTRFVRSVRANPGIMLGLISALIVSTSAQAGASHAARPSPAPLQDKGPVDSTARMTVTVWTRNSDQAAFDSALAARYDRQSPLYHRWLTAAEMAAFGPSTSELELLRASLAAEGLTIEQVADDASAIRVSGSMATMQTAFNTTIHRFESDGRSYFANIAEPNFRGAHADLIASVTGLSNLGPQAYALRQVDPQTGKPIAGVAAAAPSPLSYFIDKCFGPKKKFVSLGGNVTATYAGPQYLTGGPFPPFCGYTVAQVAAHYGLDKVYAKGWTGKGQTIVIVDAYGSASIRTDANVFSKAMGLPELTSSNFEILYPDGQPIGDGSQTNWPEEVSLDVEWAHGLAPDANIVLVVAPLPTDDELAYAINYAVGHHLGDVVSNSFGAPEQLEGPATARAYNAVFKKAAAQGIAINVATGDDGDNGLGTPLGAASVPADSPFATGVGGTSIGVPSDIGFVEAAWGISYTILATALPENPPFAGGFEQGGGGGESILLAKPGFQKLLPGIGRQLPDISAIADPQTGAIAVVPDALSGGSDYTVVGGTSLATPVFSAIWALANQVAGKSLGQAAPLIAEMPAGALRDILPISAFQRNTSGVIKEREDGFTITTSYTPAQLLGAGPQQEDGFVGVITHPTSGLVELADLGFGLDSSLIATVGWDNATGWGVVNGAVFIEAASRLAERGATAR